MIGHASSICFHILSVVLQIPLNSKIQMLIKWVRSTLNIRLFSREFDLGGHILSDGEAHAVSKKHLLATQRGIESGEITQIW